MRFRCPAVFRCTQLFLTHRRASSWADGIVLGRCADRDRSFAGEISMLVTVMANSVRELKWASI